MKKEDYPAGRCYITVAGIGGGMLVNDDPQDLIDSLTDGTPFVQVSSIDQRTCGITHAWVRPEVVLSVAEILPLRWHEHVPLHLLDTL